MGRELGGGGGEETGKSAGLSQPSKSNTPGQTFLGQFKGTPRKWIRVSRTVVHSKMHRMAPSSRHSNPELKGCHLPCEPNGQTTAHLRSPGHTQCSPCRSRSRVDGCRAWTMSTMDITLSRAALASSH